MAIAIAMVLSSAIMGLTALISTTLFCLAYTCPEFWKGLAQSVMEES